MADFTVADVKALREKTGAGMMDAKKALTETDGDMEAAVDWLRTKGLAKAAKKSGRTAAEGLVAVKVHGGHGVAIEVNSETDFVGKNAEFQSMVSGIADVALTVSDIEALNKAQLGDKPVSEVITDAIAKIGENMSLRRVVLVEGDNLTTYLHGTRSFALLVETLVYAAVALTVSWQAALLALLVGALIMGGFLLGNFIELDLASALQVILLGFIGGTLSGFIGSGGAFFMTPGMMNLGVEGVVAVASGYQGGHVPDPTYKQVCGGNTVDRHHPVAEGDSGRIGFGSHVGDGDGAIEFALGIIGERNDGH